jgi:hypothetical protein
LPIAVLEAANLNSPNQDAVKQQQIKQEHNTMLSIKQMV